MTVYHSPDYRPPTRAELDQWRRILDFSHAFRVAEDALIEEEKAKRNTPGASPLDKTPKPFQ